MQITIAAVGRLKAGPERALFDRYLERAAQSGRSLGLTVRLRELAESRAQRADERMAQEAAALLELVPDGARLLALDERGETMTSDAFATWFGRERGGGQREIVLAIGGADGHGAAVKSRADRLLAFGAMTWPHQLVRILLAEQLYRATTILSGHPYHRS